MLLVLVDVVETAAVGLCLACVRACGTWSSGQSPGCPWLCILSFPHGNISSLGPSLLMLEFGNDKSKYIFNINCGRDMMFMNVSLLHSLDVIETLTFMIYQCSPAIADPRHDRPKLLCFS